MKKTGRKRGAQRGNTNALKHGLYSEHISSLNGPHGEHQLDAMPPDKNDSELALVRVLLKDLLKKRETASGQEWFKYERAIEHYLDKIISMTHKNAILGRDGSTSLVTVMAMIRQINEEQDVR